MSQPRLSAVYLSLFVLCGCGSDQPASAGGAGEAGAAHAGANAQVQSNSVEKAGDAAPAPPKAGRAAPPAQDHKPDAAAPSGANEEDAGAHSGDADAGASDEARDTRWDGPYTGKYTDDKKWLCRPGLPNNPCDATQRITEFQPDGGRSVTELPMTPSDAGVDCFYVYPTVDTGLFDGPRNLDFPQIDLPTVLDVMSGQALPFRPLCRIFAPVYRQASLVTFTADDKTREAGLDYGYADVSDAFDYFLHNTDARRPLVLLAHSQGSIVTLRLLVRRIQDDPQLRKRLVVAVLAGPLGGFSVPRGQLVGGSLKVIPLCSSQRQTGCALTYASFIDTNPPSADYAKVGGGIPDGYDTGCTNPPSYTNELARGAGALFVTRFRQTALSVQLNVQVDTDFARFGNFYTLQCKASKQGLGYLEVAIAPLPGDKRQNAVPFDTLALSDASLGLHALDYSFIAAELFDAVKTKIDAYAQ